MMARKQREGRTRREVRFCLVLAALCFLPDTSLAADLIVDGVPLPVDAHVSALPRTAPDIHRRFIGAWVGSWEGAIRHVLVVESIRPNGEAAVIYAVGDNPWAKTARAWHRHEARVSGDVLKIATTFTATYKLETADTLRANWQRGENRALAKLSKIEFATLTRAESVIPWTLNKVEFVMLDTNLREGGRAIRLEAVLYRPKGEGPFPLFVFNHGSTGSGRETKRFRETWSSFTLADFFVEKGWAIAFPQRRGRGRSGGLYDEGFAPDRRQGYACNVDRALRGAERALVDIEAAIAALQQRPDVGAQPILIGGQSRGALLSLLYAARHRDQVHGVINFVGGWLAEACNVSGQVNRTLFQRGAEYDRPTLWLYGKGDTAYSMQHSRSNFEAFRAAGGLGMFVEGLIPNRGDGHGVIEWPQLWAEPVDRYLKALGAPRDR